jgi:hypothetical protein
MITNIDPYLVWPSTFAARSALRSASTAQAAPRARHSGFDWSRAAREEAFERIHGSLWDPRLLERLNSPLTRHPE